jgi:hypothetical protein
MGRPVIHDDHASDSASQCGAHNLGKDGEPVSVGTVTAQTVWETLNPHLLPRVMAWFAAVQRVRAALRGRPHLGVTRRSTDFARDNPDGARM